MGKKILRSFTIIYTVMGIFFLLLIPASVNGWFGMVPSKLSGIFAMIFGLPWTLHLNLSEATTPYESFFVSAAGIALNSLILFWLSRRP